jgi:hypothetical protein
MYVSYPFLWVLIFLGCIGIGAIGNGIRTGWDMMWRRFCSIPLSRPKKPSKPKGPRAEAPDPDGTAAAQYWHRLVEEARADG